MRVDLLRPMLLAALLASSGCKDKGGVPERAKAAEPAAARAPLHNKEVAPAPGDTLGTLEPGLGMAVGSVAPEVSARDSRGNEVSIRALLREKPLVLVFYRGGWCPFCNFQVRELVEHAQGFAARGVQLAAVSVDQPDKASETAAHYTIPFPVLSDPELTVHRAFHVVHQASDGEVVRLRNLGMDIEGASGRKHHAFAVPSVFVIGTDRVVRRAHANTNYKVRPSAQQLLGVLDSLGLAP